MWYNFESGSKTDFSDYLEPGTSKEKARRRKTDHTDTSNHFEVLQQIDDIHKELTNEFVGKLVRFLRDSKYDKDHRYLKTAIVQCGFSSGTEVLGILNSNMVTSKEKLIHIHGKGAVLHSIENDLAENKSNILLLDGIEGCTGEYTENLLKILLWHRRNYSITVILCTSTNISDFAALCSLPVLNRLKSETFTMPSFKTVFNKVSNLLLRNDNSSSWFSIEVIDFLKSKYYRCDHSISNLKQTIRFLVYFHHLEHGAVTSEVLEIFQSHINVYWTVLSQISKFLGQNWNEEHMYQIHKNIQNDTPFWKDDNSPIYHLWRSSMRVLPTDRIRSFAEELQAILETLIDDGQELSMELEDAFKLMDVSTKDETGEAEEVLQDDAKENEKAEQGFPFNSNKKKAKESKKLTAVELKKLNSQQIKKKQDQYLKSNRNDVINVLEKHFSILLPKWKDIPNAREALVDGSHLPLLTIDPARNIEKALTSHTKKEIPPIVLAYQVLQDREKWKYVEVSRFGTEFVKMIPPSLQKHGVAAFYATLGQLESMGMIRASPGRNDGRLAVLYYPTA